MSAPSITTLSSPALYLGTVEVHPRPQHRRRRRSPLRAARLKKGLSQHLYWWLRHLPPAVTAAYVRALAEGIQGTRILPGHALVAAARDVSRIAAARGIRHAPREVAHAFVDRIRIVLQHAVRLYHHGPDAVRHAIEVPPGTQASLEAMLAGRGAGMIAVPHNPGAVFSALEVSRRAPMVLVSKNSPSVERTRMALDFYERMGLRVLMVRGGNPFEVSRACLRALRDGQVLVATLDSIARDPGRLEVPIFGREVGFPSWAARIAVKARVPIVPAYVVYRNGRFRVDGGDLLEPKDPHEAVRGYVGFFEEKILEDPASWSFLADKRWRRVLAAAARSPGEASDVEHAG